MKKARVINWYPKSKFIRGLRELFKMSRTTHTCEIFVFNTIRMGEKWANKLNPGDRVAISISHDEKQPRIIGYAEVKSVTKKFAFELDARDLADNVGAQTSSRAILDLYSVYGPRPNPFFVVSVIKLCVL